jgi:phage shock protein C
MSTATANRTIRRPFAGRMFAGVAAGISEQLGVDPNLVRIGFAVLTLAGPGIPLYLAALLLIPEEGSDESIASSIINSLRR